MFGRKRKQTGFEVRSVARDVEVEMARAKSILDVIENVISEADAEKNGLQRRLSDVLARTSVTFGNDSDEYTTRDAVSDSHQQQFSMEIRYAENRLKQLNDSLDCYKSFKALALSILRSNAPQA